MPYLPNPNTYLHQSSLLLQAYPSARVTTKYSLPRHPNPHSKSTTSNRAEKKAQSTTPNEQSTEATANRKKEPTATLTLKTFEPNSGICLKYRTDKAAEVGRLMVGLGRLAGGEVVEMPAAATSTGPQATGEEEDRMEVDGTAAGGGTTEATAAAAVGPGKAVAGAGTGGAGGTKPKKKKGKK